MSKIVDLSQYELVLTYSWHKNSNHGICGHTYEIIDYFYILSKHFSCCIFLSELNWSEFNIILSKYNFSDDEILNYKKNIFFCKNPILVKGNNILLVDGGFHIVENKKIIFKNIFAFPCGIRQLPKTSKKINVFGDTRIYDFGTHYVKKLLLTKLITPKNSKHRILLYGTSNCRLIPQNYIDNIKKDVLIIQDKKNEIVNNTEYKTAPIDNIFEEFDEYIYTSVPRKFDCSPRFLVECTYFNKTIKFDLDYDMKEDPGLYWRVHDINNNFNSLILRDDDEIIKLLKDNMKVT